MLFMLVVLLLTRRATHLMLSLSRRLILLVVALAFAAPAPS